MIKHFKLILLSLIFAILCSGSVFAAAPSYYINQEGTTVPISEAGWGNSTYISTLPNTEGTVTLDGNNTWYYTNDSTAQNSGTYNINVTGKAILVVGPAGQQKEPSFTLNGYITIVDGASLTIYSGGDSDLSTSPTTLQSNYLVVNPSTADHSAVSIGSGSTLNLYYANCSFNGNNKTGISATTTNANLNVNGGQLVGGFIASGDVQASTNPGLNFENINTELNNSTIISVAGDLTGESKTYEGITNATGISSKNCVFVAANDTLTNLNSASGINPAVFIDESSSPAEKVTVKGNAIWQPGVYGEFAIGGEGSSVTVGDNSSLTIPENMTVTVTDGDVGGVIKVTGTGSLIVEGTLDLSKCNQTGLSVSATSTLKVSGEGNIKYGNNSATLSGKVYIPIILDVSGDTDGVSAVTDTSTWQPTETAGVYSQEVQVAGEGKGTSTNLPDSSGLTVASNYQFMGWYTGESAPTEADQIINEVTYLEAIEDQKYDPITLYPYAIQNQWIMGNDASSAVQISYESTNPSISNNPAKLTATNSGLVLTQETVLQVYVTEKGSTEQALDPGFTPVATVSEDDGNQITVTISAQQTDLDYIYSNYDVYVYTGATVDSSLFSSLTPQDDASVPVTINGWVTDIPGQTKYSQKNIMLNSGNTTTAFTTTITNPGAVENASPIAVFVTYTEDGEEKTAGPSNWNNIFSALTANVTDSTLTVSITAGTAIQSGTQYNIYFFNGATTTIPGEKIPTDESLANIVINYQSGNWIKSTNKGTIYINNSNVGSIGTSPLTTTVSSVSPVYNAQTNTTLTPYVVKQGTTNVLSSYPFTVGATYQQNQTNNINVEITAAQTPLVEGAYTVYFYSNNEETNGLSLPLTIGSSSAQVDTSLGSVTVYISNTNLWGWANTTEGEIPEIFINSGQLNPTTSIPIVNPSLAGILAGQQLTKPSNDNYTVYITGPINGDSKNTVVYQSGKTISDSIFQSGLVSGTINSDNNNLSLTVSVNDGDLTKGAGTYNVYIYYDLNGSTNAPDLSKTSDNTIPGNAVQIASINVLAPQSSSWVTQTGNGSFGSVNLGTQTPAEGLENQQVTVNTPDSWTDVQDIEYYVFYQGKPVSQSDLPFEITFPASQTTDGKLTYNIAVNEDKLVNSSQDPQVYTVYFAYSKTGSLNPNNFPALDTVNGNYSSLTVNFTPVPAPTTINAYAYGSESSWETVTGMSATFNMQNYVPVGTYANTLQTKLTQGENEVQSGTITGISWTTATAGVSGTITFNVAEFINQTNPVILSILNPEGTVVIANIKIVSIPTYTLNLDTNIKTGDQIIPEIVAGTDAKIEPNESATSAGLTGVYKADLDSNTTAATDNDGISYNLTTAPILDTTWNCTVTQSGNTTKDSTQDIIGGTITIIEFKAVGVQAVANPYYVGVLGSNPTEVPPGMSQITANLTVDTNGTNLSTKIPNWTSTALTANTGKVLVSSNSDNVTVISKTAAINNGKVSVNVSVANNVSAETANLTVTIPSVSTDSLTIPVIIFQAQNLPIGEGLTGTADYSITPGFNFTSGAIASGVEYTGDGQNAPTVTGQNVQGANGTANSAAQFTLTYPNDNKTIWAYTNSSGIAIEDTSIVTGGANSRTNNSYVFGYIAVIEVAQSADVTIIDQTEALKDPEVTNVIKEESSINVDILKGSGTVYKGTNANGDKVPEDQPEPEVGTVSYFAQPDEDNTFLFWIVTVEGNTRAATSVGSLGPGTYMFSANPLTIGVNGNDVDVSAFFTEAEVTEVTLNITPSTAGTIKYNGSTYTDGSKITVPVSEPFTLSATANGNYQFVKYTSVGANSTGGAATSTFTITPGAQSTAITANFAETSTLIPVILNINISGGSSSNQGSGQIMDVTNGNLYTATSSSSGTTTITKTIYVQRQTGSATAALQLFAAGVNAQFTGWQIGNATPSNPSSEDVTFTVQNDSEITANFKVVPKQEPSTGPTGPTGGGTTSSYTVTTNVSPTGGGKVVGGGKYTGGTIATLQAEPNQGYTFSGWQINGKIVSTANPYRYTVNSNVTVTAVFTQATPEAPDITLSPDSLSLNPLGIGTVKVTITPETIEPVTVTSSNPDVASVSYDPETGEITVVGGSQAGTAVVTVKCGQTTKTFTVTVGSPSVETLDISPDPVYLTTLSSGTTSQQLEALLSTGGQAENVTWSISPTTVATVSDTGVVTAVAEGEAIVTATSGDMSASANVIVNNNPVICSSIMASGTTPDTFTVTVFGVKANPAINANATINNVSIFTWSGPDQNDMQCVRVLSPVSPGSDNYAYQPFQVNGDQQYYFNADNIYVQAYGSTDSSQGNYLGSGENYKWVNPMTASTNTVGYITYQENNAFNRPTVFNGAISGEIGKHLQLEGVRISSNIYGVDVVTDVHEENIGWVEAVGDGVYAGTQHQHRQLEAIRLRLEGQYASNYDIYYQVHAEDKGWMGPVGATQIAGTVGEHRQIEAIQVQIVPKGTVPTGWATN